MLHHEDYTRFGDAVAQTFDELAQEGKKLYTRAFPFIIRKIWMGFCRMAWFLWCKR